MGCSGKQEKKKKGKKRKLLLLRLPTLAVGLRCRLLSGEFSNRLVVLLKFSTLSKYFLLQRFWEWRAVSRFLCWHRRVVGAVCQGSRLLAPGRLNFLSSIVPLGARYSWAHLLLQELKPALWLPAHVNPQWFHTESSSSSNSSSLLTVWSWSKGFASPLSFHFDRLNQPSLFSSLKAMFPLLKSCQEPSSCPLLEWVHLC